MERNKLSNYNDVEIVSEIYKVSEQIKNYTNFIRRNYVDIEKLNRLNKKVIDILDYWTGRTYVGIKKDKKLEESFQVFFVSFYDFLLACKDSKIELYKELAEQVLYRGILYRRLGYPSDSRNTSFVIPEYNEIFVSWSKNCDNTYFYPKYNSYVTIMTCNVDEPYYGIDLEPFGVVKGNEQEVVFPTIDNTIINIEYYNREKKHRLE